MAADKRMRGSRDAKFISCRKDTPMRNTILEIPFVELGQFHLRASALRADRFRRLGMICQWWHT